MSKAFRTKIFKNGGSQAIRIPKACRIDSDEVLIRREGMRLVIEPVERSHSRAFVEMVLGDVDETMPAREVPEGEDEREGLDR
jgi:antitoxin VapB